MLYRIIGWQVWDALQDLRWAEFEKLVFCFDGDKVRPTATPAGLSIENCKPNWC